jgi:hypothetical protein
MRIAVNGRTAGRLRRRPQETGGLALVGEVSSATTSSAGSVDGPNACSARSSCSSATRDLRRRRALLEGSPVSGGTSSRSNVLGDLSPCRTSTRSDGGGGPRQDRDIGSGGLLPPPSRPSIAWDATWASKPRSAGLGDARGALGPLGIGVLISPGLVRTDMTTVRGHAPVDAARARPASCAVASAGRRARGRYLHAEHDDIEDLSPAADASSPTT